MKHIKAHECNENVANIDGGYHPGPMAAKAIAKVLKTMSMNHADCSR